MLVKNSQKYYNFNGKYALRNKIVKLINQVGRKLCISEVFYMVF